jgi:hypothetical protein
VGLIPSLYTVKVAMAPLPPPFLTALTSIEVESSLEEASVVRLHFELSQTALGDWDVLQFDIFRPLVPVSISVMLGKFLPETLVNGYVREVRLNNRTQPGASTLEVVAFDATATLMDQIEMPMPHPNMSDSVIATTIFARYAMIPMAFPPTAPGRTVMDTTTTQRVTDIRLLREIAERNAYECFVQPDPLLGLDVGHFHPPQLMMPPQGVLSTNFGLATNMETFDVSNDMLEPTSALALWLDPSTKAPLPAPGLAATEAPMGLEPALLRIVPPPMVRPAATFSANYSEVLANSLSIANRSSRCVRGSGTVDGIKYGKVLRPGLPVAVRGVGREHSGNYYVTRVTHSVSTDHYTQSFEAWRNAVGLTGAEIFVDPMAVLS